MDKPKPKSCHYLAKVRTAAVDAAVLAVGVEGRLSPSSWSQERLRRPRIAAAVAAALVAAAVRQITLSAGGSKGRPLSLLLCTRGDEKKET